MLSLSTMELMFLSRTTVCLLLCVIISVHVASGQVNLESSSQGLDTTTVGYERKHSTEAAAILNEGTGSEMTPTVVEVSEEAPGNSINSMPRTTRHWAIFTEGVTGIANEIVDSNTFQVPTSIEFENRSTHKRGSLSEGTTELSNELTYSTVTNDLISSISENRQTGFQTTPGGFSDFDLSMTDDYRIISAHLLRVYARNQTLGSLAFTISTICPEWKPCYGIYEILYDMNITPNPLGVNICCLECSCKNSCIMGETCCPGFEPSNLVEKPRVVLPTSCLQSVLFTNSESLIASSPYFEMVVSCPHDTPEELVKNCTALLPDYLMDTGLTRRLIDVIPVTDLITMNTFANWYCASCNELPFDDLRFWKTDFTCTKDEIPLVKGTFETSIQQREECYLTVQPPTDANDFLSRCFNYKHVETRCNATSRWMNYDPEIAGLCKTVNWLYEDPSNRKKYKNIFCAACNGEKIADHEARTCPSIQFDEPDLVSNYEGTLNMNASTDDRLSDLIQPYDSSATCPKGERFDTLSVACRTVICSYPRLLNYITMDCEDIFEHINFGLVEMQFKYVPSVTHYIEDIQAFTTTFIQLKESVGTNCIAIDAFYKIDKPYIDFVYESDLNDHSGRVIAVLVLVRMDLSIISRQTLIEQFSNISVDFLGKSISFLYGTWDSFYLPPYATLHSEDNAAKYASISSPLYHRYALYEDMYDGFAILFDEYSQGYDSCASGSLLYDRSYFSCPSFVYDTHIDMISRVPDGVVFVEQNIKLEFGQFRSMNYTHIAICVDTVYELGVDDEEHSSSTTKMQDLSLYTVCFFAVLVTAFTRLQPADDF